MTARPRCPFAGLAHHEGAPGAGADDQEPSFRRATAERGMSGTDFFEVSGIAQTAEANGGMCTFRMGDEIAIYQSRNVAHAEDDDLAPSLDANRDLFGDFMGSLANDDPRRRAKRLAIENTLGNARFIDSVEADIRSSAREYLRSASGASLPLDEFALELVAWVDSWIPGVLDLRVRPLTEYLRTKTFGRLARDFFEIASEVIGNADPAAMRELESLAPFVRAVLDDNFATIAAAPPTNLIQRSFADWGLAFTRAAIASLDEAKINELATILVASYDTTCLSLLWAIGYVEADPSIKARLVHAIESVPGAGPLSTAELVALEAVRIAGSNPTALYRRVVRPFVLRHDGAEVSVPVGTKLWLDRRRANQDPRVFPNPERFDLDNARALCRTSRETLSSVLSRGRYEINSFSMVNTVRNPRKCPGRLFSVRLQAILLEEIHTGYEVAVTGTDLELREFSSMPRPRRPGTILIAAKERRASA